MAIVKTQSFVEQTAPTKTDLLVGALSTGEDRKITHGNQFRAMRLGFDIARYSEEFASLSEAITALDSTATRLIINSNLSVTSGTLSTHANTLVEFAPGGKITTSGGATVTINKLADPGNRQVFDGDIKLTKGASEYHNATWWGAIGDGTTNNATAIGKAVASVNAVGGILYFPGGEFRSNSTHSLESNVWVIGQGGNANNSAAVATCATKLRVGADNTAFFTIGELKRDIHFRDLCFLTDPALFPTGTVGVKFTGASPNSSQVFSFTNCFFEELVNGIDVLATDGSFGWQCSYMKVDHCTFRYCASGVRIKAINCEMSLTNCQFYQIDGDIGVLLERSGHVYMRNCWALGLGSPYCSAETTTWPYDPTFNANFGEALCKVTGQHGPVTFVQCFGEGVPWVLINEHADLTIPYLAVGCRANFLLTNSAQLTTIGCNYAINGVVLKQNSVLYRYGDLVDRSKTTCGSTPGSGGLSAAPALANGVVLYDAAFVGGEVNDASGRFLLGSFGDVRQMYGTYGTASEALVNIATDNTLAPSKTLLFLGTSDSTTKDPLHGYKFSRNGSTGGLVIDGTQADPFQGVEVAGYLTATTQIVAPVIRATPVTLADTAPIATNAALGSRFRASSSVDRTLAAPSGASDGQQCVWRWKNTDASARTLTLDTGTGGFRLNGFTIAATNAGKYLMVTAEYHLTDNKWDVLAVVNQVG